MQLGLVLVDVVVFDLVGGVLYVWFSPPAQGAYKPATYGFVWDVGCQITIDDFLVGDTVRTQCFGCVLLDSACGSLNGRNLCKKKKESCQ